MLKRPQVSNGTGVTASMHASLEERLTRLEGRTDYVVNPRPGAKMSMGNLSANYPPLTGPTGGFSNPGGAGNLGATTSGISLDQFN